MAFVKLTRAKKGLVGVDEEQGVGRGRLLGADGPHVRSLFRLLHLVHCPAKLLELKAGFPHDEKDVNGVARECEDMPRLEAAQEPWLDLGVSKKEVVEPSRGRLAELLDAWRRALELIPGKPRDLQRSNEPVPIQAFFPKGFR